MRLRTAALGVATSALLAVASPSAALASDHTTNDLPVLEFVGTFPTLEECEVAGARIVASGEFDRFLCTQPSGNPDWNLIGVDE